MSQSSKRIPKILIIEDDAVSRNILMNIFKSEQWEIIEAGDGITGLEMARSERPEVSSSLAISFK